MAVKCSIALEAGKLLAESDVAVRVVSLPSWEIFDAQSVKYRDSVLPPGVKARVSIEAATPMGWERYVGPGGAAIGISGFGASAPPSVIYEKYGLTSRNVADTALRLLGGGE